VIAVRPSVWFTAVLTTAWIGAPGVVRRFSRTRSKVTMVSFTE